MQPPQLGRVVLWMTGALLSFSLSAVSIRGLAGHLSIFELLSIRSGSGILIMVAILALRPDLRAAAKPRRMALNLVRNSVHYSAQYLWSLSLTLLPLATVFSLEFTSPAWTALLATFLLGERMTPSRIGAVALGIVGVLIILRPGFESFQPAALLVLTAAFGFSASVIATKKLTATESTLAIVFWMNVMQFPMSLAGSAPDFITRMTESDIAPAIGLAISGVSSHYCLSNAFRAGDATLVVPLDFLRIPLIALVGWTFYGEALDAFVFAGAAVIVAGIVWNLRAEARRPWRMAAAAASPD